MAVHVPGQITGERPIGGQPGEKRQVDHVGSRHWTSCRLTNVSTRPSPDRQGEIPLAGRPIGVRNPIGDVGRYWPHPGFVAPRSRLKAPCPSGGCTFSKPLRHAADEPCVVDRPHRLARPNRQLVDSEARMFLRKWAGRPGCSRVGNRSGVCAETRLGLGEREGAGSSAPSG